jgi:hypothetical protein
VHCAILGKRRGVEGCDDGRMEPWAVAIKLGSAHCAPGRSYTAAMSGDGNLLEYR